MSQTLQNQLLLAKSMNGIITFDDGAGTVISDGTINTENLDVNNLNTQTFTTNNMIVNYMSILRDSNPVVNAALGFTVDIGLLVQNMNFDDINRLFQIWNDTASSPVFAVDVANAIISFGGTARFNSNLPTTTITSGFASNNFITKLYGDSVYQPIGSYPTLSGTNNFTGINTFNNNLPTSTLTPTTSTQLITKGYGDGAYGQLATTNTWALQNTFSTGILPRASSAVTDIQIGGNNQLQYRRSPSAFNISIGENAVRGYPSQPTWNVGQRNIGIGDGACQEVMGGNDNIGIGYRALKSGSGGTYGQGVTPFRCIAIGSSSQTNGLYGTDNISVGYNSLQNIGSGNNNISIGSSTGNAISNVSSNIIIGSGAAPTVVDNAMTIIGYQACGAATANFNSGVAIGTQSCYNNAGGAGNTAIGAQSLFSNTTGYNNTAIGCFAGQNNPNNLNNMVCLGRDSTAQISQECVMGGELISNQVYLTLPQKVRLNCCQIVGAVASYTIAWRSNETIVITSATTTTINLPQAVVADAIHVGACFNIIRTSAATSDINITGFGTEKINYSGLVNNVFQMNSWNNSVSLVCVDYVSGNGVWSICRYNPRVTLANDANKLQTVTDSTNVNYPVAFTTINPSGTYSAVYANSNLTYNPSTSNMTLTGNLTVTGSVSGTTTNATNVNINDQTISGSTYYMNFSTNQTGSSPINSSTNITFSPLTNTLNMYNGTIKTYKTQSTNYSYFNQPSLILGATTLTDPLYSLYQFSMTSTSGYTITLPTITTTNVGSQLVFKRISGSLQILSLATTGTTPIFMLGNNTGNVISGTTTIAFITASQSCGKICSSQICDTGAGTFTNTVGSSTITIVSQSSGNLVIGSKVNLNGNARTITVLLTGLGGTGTYMVDTAIAAANTNQAYTQSISYGWCAISIQ